MEFSFNNVDAAEKKNLQDAFKNRPITSKKRPNKLRQQLKVRVSGGRVAALGWDALARTGGSPYPRAANNIYQLHARAACLHGTNFIPGSCYIFVVWFVSGQGASGRRGAVRRVNTRIDGGALPSAQANFLGNALSRQPTAAAMADQNTHNSFFSSSTSWDCTAKLEAAACRLASSSSSPFSSPLNLRSHIEQENSREQARACNIF
jgi:hypothetical protein